MDLGVSLEMRGMNLADVMVQVKTRGIVEGVPEAQVKEISSATGGILFQLSKRERRKGDERSAFLEPLDFVQSRKIIYSLHFAPPPLPYASLKFPFTTLERTTDFNSIHAFEVLGYFPASSVVAFMMRSNKKKKIQVI